MAYQLPTGAMGVRLSGRDGECLFLWDEPELSGKHFRRTTRDQRSAAIWPMRGVFTTCTETLGNCVDWYGDYPLGSSPDLVVPAGGGTVGRGGSWFNAASSARCASRLDRAQEGIYTHVSVPQPASKARNVSEKGAHCEGKQPPCCSKLSSVQQDRNEKVSPRCNTLYEDRIAG